MTPLPAPLRPLTALARIAALATGWWLLAFSLVTCAEVVLRRGFGTSLQAVDELGGYSLAVVSALALSWALLAKGHVRVDFLLGKLPAGLRAVLHVVAYAALAASAVFAAWRGWFVLSESIEFGSRANTPLGTPLWLPQSLWWAGMVLFALVATGLALHALALLARGRLRQLDAEYGPMTLDEEIEREVGAAR